MFALQQQARQRHAAAAAAAAAGFSFDDHPVMSTGDLDAMQKQYRDQLNALDYDEMMMSGGASNRSRQPSSSSSHQQQKHHQHQQQQHDEVLHMDDGLRSTLSPPLRNKFVSTPPARPNSTPPGRNMYNEMDRQTEMMMNQFGGFGLNEEVSVCT